MTDDASIRDAANEWSRAERECDTLGDAFAEAVRAEAGGFLDTGALASVAPALDESEENVAWLRGVVAGVRILREIGRGGMGVVYEGVEESTGRRVAVKLLHADRRTPGLVRRLQREAQAMARVEHPGVTRLYGAGACAPPLAGSPYIVMELVRGVDPIAHAEAKGLSVRERVALMARVAEAVGAAHAQGVLHLDLKPGNVLVREDGSVKVLDFGIARVLDEGAGDATMTFLTHPFGSISAMAPEQADGRAGSAATDVFALGTLLYRLLTGRHPFDIEGAPPAEAARRMANDEPTPARRLNRAVSADLAVVVRTALAKQSKDRYPNAAALAADLSRALRDEPIVARRPSAVRRMRAYAARRPALVASVSVAALTIMIGAAAATTQAVRAVRAEERALERFDDVRALANTVIFELHDEIEDLPGATRARLVLVERALQYLDSLAIDPHADADLRLEIAEAYLEIARVQGDLYNSSLGDYAGWARNVDTSFAMLERLIGERPDDLLVQLVYARASHMRLVSSMQQSRRAWSVPMHDDEPRHLYESFFDQYRSIEATLDRVFEASPDNVDARRLSATMMFYRGLQHNSWHEGAQAVEWLAKSYAEYERLRALAPDDVAIARDAIQVMHYLGYIRSLNGAGGGGDLQREARSRLMKLLDERPWSTSLRYLLAIVTGRLGTDLSEAGEHDAAVAMVTEALSMAIALYEHDPYSMVWHRINSVTTSTLSEALERRAMDTARTISERLASAHDAHQRRVEAIAFVDDRAARGWLPQWESHYPDRERAALARVQLLIDALEAERGAGAANAQ